MALNRFFTPDDGLPIRWCKSSRKNTSAMPVESEFHWLKMAMYVAENTTDEEIVVDISAVEKIQSAELNQLIRLHLDVKQDGRSMVLERAATCRFGRFLRSLA